MKSPRSLNSNGSQFDCYSCSRAGLDVVQNEDAKAVDPCNGVFVVADGMGGRPNGGLASQIAVEAFLNAIVGFSSRERLRPSALDEAVSVTNRAVRRCARAAPERNGMGTTLSAAIVAGRSGRIVHVGDSRVYLFHKGRLQQLTRDHTLAQELVGNRRANEEDANGHPLGHVLSRTIGTRDSVVADIQRFTLLPGDGLILTSDGISRVLTHEELGKITRQHWENGARRVCNALLRSACAKQPTDDLTVIVTKVLPKRLL